MSYKSQLSDLDRDSERSLTAQLVDLIAAAIASGELSAEPVELLDEHYPGAEARRGERRRHPAEAAADDEDVGTHLAGGPAQGFSPP